MPRDITLLQGVGPVTAQRLGSAGIFTISDLANSPIDNSLVKNAAALKQKAIDYLAQATNSNKIPMKDTSQKTQRYLVSNHSWYEQQITLPVETSPDTYELRRAVIYELSIESFNRISFICSYFEPESGRQVLCNFTKSPLYILTFNGDRLPLLEITISKRQFSSLPNNYVLYDTIREVSAIQTLKKC